MEDKKKLNKINLYFNLLTGGSFTLTVDNDNITLDLLKKIVSKKLKISKERICLMNSERELNDGTLKDYGIMDGSKIIVTPNVETGLAQRTENTVMQALESLNDDQVNDFLSGKSPLNLSVRLNDHMMLIQLQLSTLSPAQQNILKNKSNPPAMKQEIENQLLKDANIVPQKRSFQYTDETRNQKKKLDIEMHSEEGKSPIRELSTMVSSPLTATVQNMNYNNNKFWNTSLDPIAANLTSCLCKRLNINCNNKCGEHIQQTVEPCCSYMNNSSPPKPKPIPFHKRPTSSSGLNFVQQTELKITEQSEKHAKGNKNQIVITDNSTLAEASRNLTQTLKKLSKKVFTSNKTDESNAPMFSSSSTNQSCHERSKNCVSNLKSTSGAVIESMKHHGKGIYSGTFSGTLNPTLQDKNGRPKRDISTIIHILNDLLSASPSQCGQDGTKIFFEPTQLQKSSLGKYIKKRKQPISKILCSDGISKSFRQGIFTIGECSEHSNNAQSHAQSKSSSTDSEQNECLNCKKILTNKIMETENIKTKEKLDHLKLVMQQKKERREARKMNIAPYVNKPHETILDPTNFRSQNFIDEDNKLSHHLNKTETNSETINHTNNGIATSSTASVSKNSSELEKHLEEVETAA